MVPESIEIPSDDDVNNNEADAADECDSSGDSPKARWWHVPDDQIEELVRRMADGAGESSSESSSPTGRGRVPKPIRRQQWSDGYNTGTLTFPESSTEVRSRMTPQDALDEMLRRMAARNAETVRTLRPEEDEEEEEEEVDFEDFDPDAPPRRPKWWHVSNQKIRELITELRAENKERQPPLANQSMMSATIGGSSAISSPVSPDSPSSPSGTRRIHVRLHALGRADPIPCPRTGRRHRALPHGDELIVAYFHMLDTGTRFSLTLHPDLRIGPDQPPPANRFTEKYGLGARTNGFTDKAQSFDYRYRRWANNPRPNWVPTWTDSVKAQIELASGVPASRQHLLLHGCPVGSDFATVRTCGIINGVELQVFTKKTETRDLRNVVLSSTAKRREVQDKRQEFQDSMRRLEVHVAQHGTTSPQGDSPKRWMMPPWKTEDMPNLFGVKDDGGGQDQSPKALKPANLSPSARNTSFGEVPIYRPDIQDQRMQRVRSLPCYTLTAARW